MLKESISSLVISGCIVWCWLLGNMCLGFFLGSMVIYRCMSHSISVSKFCIGGCRKLVRWVRLLLEKRVYSPPIDMTLQAQWRF